LQTFIEFIQQGFLHVLPLGYDHILFITSLFFLNSNLKSVLIQCSIFTIAHSITLFLSAYQILNSNTQIVEPIIALSIVITAFENIVHSRISKWRLLIIFIFGLIHGMGFAAALQDIGVPSSNFITALLSFNIGVELAQVAIILMLYFAIAKWMSHKTWYQNRVVYPISCSMACVGLYWVIDKIMI
jgi:HupE / UreJ protein